MRRFTVVLLILVLTHAELAAASSGKSGPPLFALMKNVQTGHGELLEMDGLSGAILHRMDLPYTVDQPELLPSLDGSRLWYLAGNGSSITLSLIDVVKWLVAATSSVPDRMHYIGPGPATMTLSPDGSRLFIYSYHVTGPGSARYWLASFDPITLQARAKVVFLPGCGVATFTAVRGQVITLCYQSNNLRFISIRHWKVTATMQLPSWLQNGTAGMFLSPDRKILTLVSVDSRFVQFSLTSHRIVRTLAALRVTNQRIPLTDGVALTGDGTHLIEGLVSHGKTGTTAYALKSFLVPRLKPTTKPVLHPDTVHLMPGPGATVYAFPMIIDATDTNWRVEVIDADLGTPRTLAQVDGPVFQVVVPGRFLGG